MVRTLRCLYKVGPGSNYKWRELSPINGRVTGVSSPYMWRYNFVTRRGPPCSVHGVYCGVFVTPATKKTTTGVLMDATYNWEVICSYYEHVVFIISVQHTTASARMIQ